MILKQLLFGSLVFVGMGLTSCAGSDKEGASTEKSDTLTNASTPASTTMTTQVSDTPAIQVSGQAPVAQATAPGMNPAHGQPGHDCSIAVGAPLNSAKKAAPGGAQPIQVQQAPQATAAPQPAAGGSGKVNPAHGQPGHDCKVAVGAPLP